MAVIQHFGRVLRWHFIGGGSAITRRFTWELPQTLLGLGAAAWAIVVMQVQQVAWRDGAVVIQGWRKQRFWGGISFGTVILGDERIAAVLHNSLYMHEFGHVLQSRASGPLYLLKYGFPSVLSVRGRGIHKQHPVEQDANLRAYRYFSQQPGFLHWDHAFNPLPAIAKPLPITWWEYMPPIFPILHILQAVRDRNGRTRAQ
jgi:hypothetical protein